MWLISLLFLPLSSAPFTIPYGIQYNSFAEEDLKSECSLCYEEDYHESTSSSDILSCAGPVLFVGSRRHQFPPWGKKTMALGAFALASAVHKTTALNTPHLSNGVYWYFTPRKSFGFLKDTDLHQEPTGDIGTTNFDHRLSWNLDNGQSGYRSGHYIEEGRWIEDYGYRKFIYNCPNNF